MSPPRFSDHTIIVVEDHDDARTYVGMFLNSLGADVILAKDGVEALEAVKNNEPNLVITDLQMPRMDGFELLKEIRALKPDRKGTVPIIAMTAVATRAAQVRLAHMGFRACLEKPFTAEELLEAILAALET
jgi:CheY-like chemotaxis protein